MAAMAAGGERKLVRSPGAQGFSLHVSGVCQKQGFLGFAQGFV